VIKKSVIYLINFMPHKKQIFFFTLAILFLTIPTTTNAQTIAQRLRGRILIQVESKGEAWYVDPKIWADPSQTKRYYLGRPDDAFNLMRSLGLGILDSGLDKIPIGGNPGRGVDTDGDGLSDAVEDALGTLKNSVDTDGDGYNDFTEVMSGNNPSGTGRLGWDLNFARGRAGQIFLQVQKHGEALFPRPAARRL